MKKLVLAAAAASASLFAISPAQASLTVFQTFVGNYGLSTDGAGSVDSSSTTISAFVPVGATVVSAYLYQSTYNFSAPAIDTITLNGNALTFAGTTTNDTACCNLTSARADVTSIVAGVVDGGLLGTYDFSVTEGNTLNTDGTALIVVYELAALPTTTVAILDGFASVTGDMASLTFADPLNPLAPGFGAEMRLGIGFSCCSTQFSTVNVNGTDITERAGNNDDGTGSGFNGRLITVGGSDDPFSPLLPTYEVDRERYNLVPYIMVGDTTIDITTFNTSADDNIFFAGFVVTGEAVVTTPGIPEPATWAMMIGGFGMVGAAIRRRRRPIQAIA